MGGAETEEGKIEERCEGKLPGCCRNFPRKGPGIFQFQRLTGTTYFVIVRKLEWFYIRVF